MTITLPTPTIAHLESNDILHDAQEAAELLINCHYQGADSLIIREENLPPAFFDLKKGLAGDILQKFSTYCGRLAIIGDFPNTTATACGISFMKATKAGGLIL